MTSSVRGIDHIGITVPDIEKATQFFERAFGAQVLYHSVDAETDNIDQPAQQHTLKLFPGTKIHAIRMLVMPHGPGIELFEMHGPEQGMPARASDFGLQHFAVYVDDFDSAIAAFTAAGGRCSPRRSRLAFRMSKVKAMLSAMVKPLGQHCGIDLGRRPCLMKKRQIYAAGNPEFISVLREMLFLIRDESEPQRQKYLPI